MVRSELYDVVSVIEPALCAASKTMGALVSAKVVSTAFTDAESRSFVNRRMIAATAVMSIVGRKFFSLSSTDACSSCGAIMMYLLASV